MQIQSERIGKCKAGNHLNQTLGGGEWAFCHFFMLNTSFMLLLLDACLFFIHHTNLLEHETISLLFLYLLNFHHWNLFLFRYPNMAESGVE